LLTVSDKASVKQELTPIFESFRQRLDKVFAGGDTVVYDALDTARRMLMNYRSDLPQLRKRIIIVTDGADTGSETSAKDACHALQRNGIIVDSVQVGHRSDNKLHAISVATGACFHYQELLRCDT
jgi:Mg-chelatase subunit ChlD